MLNSNYEIGKEKLLSLIFEGQPKLFLLSDVEVSNFVKKKKIGLSHKGNRIRKS